jgi:hypothetical protein
MLLCPRCHMAVQVPPHLLGQAVGCPVCGSPLVAPPSAFDPYYTWLGIPPAEQPPHHYRLLGVQLFEANPQVIENAADRQMKHLQSFKIGARAADSQRLLTEVSAARVCLLDPASKAIYDQQLRLASAPQPTAAPFASLTAPPALHPAISQRSVQRPIRKKGPGSLLSSVMIVLGGVTGLAIAILGIFYVTGQDVLGLSGKIRQQVAAQPAQEKSRSGTRAQVETSRPADVSSPAVAPRSSQTATPALPPNVPPASNATVAPQHNPAELSAQRPTTPAPAPSPPTTLADLANQRQKPKPFQAIRLPPIDSSDLLPLFRFPEEPREPVIVTLADEAADFPAKSRIDLSADPQGRGWIIHYASDEGSSSAHATLGVIRREGLELKFAWSFPALPADAEARRQLANCLLEIRVGSETATLQLREPVHSSPLVLDLNRELQTLEILAPGLPPSSKLVVKIRELHGFSKGGRLRGTSDSFPFVKPAVIEFTDLAGPKVGLRFVRPVGGEKLVLRVEPVFHEGGNKEFEFTFARLEKFRSGVEKSLENARSAIPVVQAEINRANATLSSLNSNPPTTVQETIQRNRAKSQAQAILEIGAQRLTYLQTQITESQVRLAAVPEMKAFMESLHQKATISYAICAAVGSKELVLVEANASVQ